MLWLALLFQIAIPKGITYRPASDAVNAPIAKLLEQSFGGSGAGFGGDFYGDVVVVGPTLWNEMRNLPTIKDADITRAAFVIGHKGGQQLALEGAQFSGDEVAHALRPALLALLQPSEPMHIRKLAAAEMKHIWTINAFKTIDEPVFAAESSSRVLMLDFAPHPEITSKGAPYRLYFIDELAPAEREAKDVVH